MDDMSAERSCARPRIETSHEQEASYSRLFAQHPTPMWVVDDATLAFLAVNEAAVRHYGYTHEEFLRMTIKDIRPPEDVALVLAYYQGSPEAQRQGRVGRAGVWHHRTKDGTLIDVDIHWSAVVFQGRKARLIIAYDVTERVRAEAALRASYAELDRRVQERTAALAWANTALQTELAERRRVEAALRDWEECLRLALQASQMGTWEWDFRTGALRLSPELERLHGFAPGSFPGTYEGFLSIVHPEDHTWFTQTVARAFEVEGAFEAEFRIRWPDGSIHWMADKGRVLYDETGQPVRMLGVGMEVTARKQAEIEAEQRRREAEVLARLAQTMGASLDLDTVLQRIAEGAWELCGSERALIMLREPGGEALVSRYQAGFPRMPYAGLRIEPGKGMGGWVLVSGRPLRTADYAADPRFSKDYLPHLRTDGQLAVLTVPITIGPRVEGVLYVSNPTARPFTECDEAILLRLAEYAASAIRNAQLYHAARDELARRTQAEAQLQASLQEKEVLLREIHHRVKNNLQIVSSLLNLQARAVDDPHLRALLHESRQRLQAMALIHEALYQTRDLARVPFGAYVRRLTAQLFRAYDAAARRIHLSVQAEPIDLDIDKAAPCGLILHELLSNAFTHAFPDGRSGTIDVVLRRTAHDITLSVTDTGVGMSQALEVRHPGSLGLKLVTMLTDQLGGSLVLAQEGGTTFTLTVPPDRAEG